MKSRLGWSTQLLVLACLASFSTKARAVDPWDTAAASSELTALYAWTTATSATTRSIEVQLFGTVFPGAISQPTLLLESDSASALCPTIEFIPERKAFAVVYSRYEPTGPTSANVSLQVALVSALTGRILTSGTMLERSVINVDADFRPQAGAFCPRAAYLTESRRLLVVWVVRRMPVASEDPLEWDASLDVSTGEDAFWGLHFNPLQRDFASPGPLALGPSVTFTRTTSAINALDVAYAPRKATHAKTGNVLVTCAGFGPGAFQEQANFFTFRANGLSGEAPSQAGWPPEVMTGFCGGGASSGPGCLPSSSYTSVAFQSGRGFGPPRFAIATTDRLGAPSGGFATLFFVPPTCSAAACPLETPGRVALTGEDAVMFEVSVAEAPCRVAGTIPGTTRGSSCVYVAFRYTEDIGGPMQWGLTAYDYGTFATSTPGPNDFLRLGELPGLTRDTLGPGVIGLTHLTRSTLPFAPAVAVIFALIRVEDGMPLDEFPRPYLVRFNTAGVQLSPAGEGGFLE